MSLVLLVEPQSRGRGKSIWDHTSDSLGMLRYDSNEKSSSSPFKLSKPSLEDGKPGSRPTLQERVKSSS